MRDDTNLSSAEDPGPHGQRGGAASRRHATLRILATTDIHMQLLGHDYVRDTAGVHHGLAGLATLIKLARAEGIPSLLVDNGDMLQGSALGDALAEMPVTPQHPVVASLNTMRYDVVGIGNHDFDHGLTYLHRIAGLSRAQFISTNCDLASASVIARAAIIPTRVRDSTGADDHTLNVGFLSVLPELTNIWNKPILQGQGHVTPAKAALEEAIPRLRQDGADIVILLAHMGVEEDLAQDDVRTLSSLTGIDALIAGHTHRRLPGIDHAGLSDVDINKGALGPRPAAMPGFNASDLAVLDLSLTGRSNGSWQVSDHKVQLRPNTAAVPADPKVAALSTPAHAKTRFALSEPLTKNHRPLHNFFALAMPTPTCALQAAATRRVVAQALQDTSHAAMPLLSAVSAHTAGGRGGPDHYLSIPVGDIFRRAVVGLSPYGNNICALRTSGAELRSWLEHSASIYCTLSRDKPDQPLLRADRPKFHFDTIYGLRYDIDPTRPAGERIGGLCYDGAPVQADQQFAVATNAFRAAGGGGGLQFGADRILFSSEVSMLDALLNGIKAGLLQDAAPSPPWSFNCADLHATLWTSPRAQDHLAEAAHLQPQAAPVGESGFLPLRLRLPGLHSPGPRNR